MTKEQIGKEIKELIRSIKTHYTFVEEEDRIPLIELELITSKIRKLYEKSIINNYLHATDDTYMSQERSRRFNERKSFEKNVPSSFVKKEPDSNPIPDQVIPKIVEQTLNNERSQPESLPVVNLEKPEPVSFTNTSSTSASKRVIKDLKLLIGINDKFLLINNLFARNDSNYKAAIEHLSALHTKEEASVFLQSLARQYEWNTESYAYARLQQIIDKRHK